MSSADWLALWLSVKLASISTLILLLICLPLAWWLAHTKYRWAVLIESAIALPLVLPPTVLGFYLLLAFSPDTWLGQTWQTLTGSQLAFSFSGLILGSVIYSLPFVMQPLQNTFRHIGKASSEAAAMLGAGPLDRFTTIILPLSRPGLITAASLGFAHTLGEFGIVLMLGGNIKNETHTASIAIFEHVESLAYGQAHQLSLALIIISFTLLVITYRINRNILFNAEATHVSSR